MNSMFLVAAFVSVVFFILKFIEMRFLLKDAKPLKHLIRDSILVYFSVITGMFIYNQVTNVTKNIKGGGSATVAFTDNPDF